MEPKQKSDPRIGDTGGQGLLPTALARERMYIVPAICASHTEDQHGTGLGIGHMRINTPLRPRLIRNSQHLAWTRIRLGLSKDLSHPLNQIYL